MNIIGERVKVLSSRDPTLADRTGNVIMETANTLVIQSDGRQITVPKAGAAFMVMDSGEVITGPDIAGRLEDRWGKGR